VVFKLYDGINLGHTMEIIQTGHGEEKVGRRNKTSEEYYMSDLMFSKKKRKGRKKRIGKKKVETRSARGRRRVGEIKGRKD